MIDSDRPDSSPVPTATSDVHAMNIVQRGNLKALEQTLRKQWRLGQSIVLCWSADERGLLVIFVPHYYLGNYCAVDDDYPAESKNNEEFIRTLISGRRKKTRDELFDIAKRLEVAPTFIKLSSALAEEPAVEHAVEELIKRYGLSYVDNRAVLLFDIAEFSLYTPFEQASQLNSLSYSLNSAYNKLLARGIEVNFARTTTGDGYYVWNRKVSATANQGLFYFLLLVIADNAVAQAASRGNTVPVIRSAYHIGSHYELYQAEGVSPTVFSYIVGDVTIELARMIELAQADQVMMGDFNCHWPALEGAQEGAIKISTQKFIRDCNRDLTALSGVQMFGKQIHSIRCQLSASENESGESTPERFRITDKHGLQHYAYNLQVEMDLGSEPLTLGLSRDQLNSRQKLAIEANKKASAVSIASAVPPTPEEMYDDLSLILKKHSRKAISEE